MAMASFSPKKPCGNTWLLSRRLKKKYERFAQHKRVERMELRRLRAVLPAAAVSGAAGRDHVTEVQVVESAIAYIHTLHGAVANKIAQQDKSAEKTQAILATMMKVAESLSNQNVPEPEHNVNNKRQIG